MRLGQGRTRNGDDGLDAMFSQAAMQRERESPKVMRTIVTVEFASDKEMGGEVTMVSGNAVQILVSPTDPRGFRYRLLAIVDGMTHRAVAESEVIAAVERRAAQSGSRIRILSAGAEEVM